MIEILAAVTGASISVACMGFMQEAMERIEALEASNTDLLARVIALEAN